VAELSLRQENDLDSYRELWADYNATAALIEMLQERLRDIKNQQRHLANRIAAATTQTGDEEES
jgi:Zn-dependent peptidase ImmA (M78 family)